jgi:seryl-tRNA synthetase
VGLFGEDPAETLALERLTFINESLRERLEEKDKLIDKLMTQIQNLQDALVNREAPEAYNALVRDRATANMTEEDYVKLERQQREFEITDKFLRESERDRLFESPDELNALFLPLRMEATEPEATHNNDES